MEFTSPEFILGIFGGGSILTAALAFFTLGPTRRKLTTEANKQGADSTAVLTSTAISLLEPMTQQIESLKQQVASLTGSLGSAKIELDTARKEIATLRANAEAMNALISQYRLELGIEPGSGT